MRALPGRPDLDQLRRQARELLRAAAASDEQALRRIRVVSPKHTLSAAQLAIAREYGFASWQKPRAAGGRRAESTAYGEGRMGACWLSMNFDLAEKRGLHFDERTPDEF